MGKYSITFFAFIALGMSVSSQVTERARLDSLKNLGKSLKGKDQIDNLNFLSEAFGVANYSDWSQKADSVFHYASIAYNEAKKIGYKKGISQALANKGKSELLRGIGRRKNKQDDLITNINAEKYLLEAINIATEVNNDEILGKAYYDLADILFYKSKRRDSNIRVEYTKKAIYYFHKSGNETLEGEACTWLCEGFSQRGMYEEGIEYCQRSIELSKKAIKETKTREDKEYRDYVFQQSLVNMATLYEIAGDYDQAFAFLRLSKQYGVENNTGWVMQSELAGLFTKTGRFDSAFLLLKDFTKNNPQHLWGNMLLGEAYLAVKDYDNALRLLLPFIDSIKIKNQGHPDLMRALLKAGNSYAGKKSYKMALAYANEGFELAKTRNARPFLMEGYQLLSRIYYYLGNADKAYQYLLKHTELKDSIINHQFLWRLNQYKISAANQKRESQLALLDRDNKIKEQKLGQQAFLKNALVVGILLILISAIFIFRNLLLSRKNEKLKMQKDFELHQLENGKKQAELHQKAIELEMQALRAQMNPHFIFNCLSSINRFIFKNDNKLASDYLTRFSRLIRMVLMHSTKKLIPLEDELEMLRIYLDLERLRFKDAFDYSITTTNIVDAGAIFIPPLLLQPFCENAVWHGLMHKESKGHLNIIISEATREEEKILHCIVEDDGVGRERAAEFKSKSAESEKSMGLKITTERLALLNQENNFSTFYKIEDVVNNDNEIAGTRVQLKIRYKESVEEIV